MSGVAGFSDYGLPGASAVYETQEKNIVWDLGQGIPNAWRTSETIVSTALDAGNTPTNLLRPGLLLGKVTSTGKLKEWNPAGTDGSQVVYGVLARGMFMADFSATAVDRYMGYCYVGGPVKAGNLLVPGQSTWGMGSTIPAADLARSQMRGRFVFDDDLPNRNSFLGGPVRYTAKTEDYAVLYTDAGSLLHTTGAVAGVTFTLPALTARAGMVVEFFNTVDVTMTIASAAADGLIVTGDLAASSIAFDVGGEKIGARCRAELLPDASKWLITSYGLNGYTVV